MKRFILSKLNKYLRAISRRERNKETAIDIGQQRATVIKAGNRANSEIEKKVYCLYFLNSQANPTCSQPKF
ncbi:MAG: hypothetical protein CLLPBCKN_007303 [Chroococcidiopsis cubana SAG 39.79]|uniref:Uncharacterized protein n=1 Tax=Chroococcidiopsis cubana SAG 39.79 TaxID=388085 RepID=A0AB37URQ9_9CYAN|nr:hypothetical protein [Chroococcidiopsis cubana SAG 39.79]PSB62763.1 hypothetical protein C7B79_16695 [Chroococcidiopsis cubana CCALA 043]RUT14140.1 hypothetical protein DSM107010_06230 [Chroococcidiopsis cubana SAG 39.79]